MTVSDELLAFAEELEACVEDDGCATCPAEGTKHCRGDMSCEQGIVSSIVERLRNIADKLRDAVGEMRDDSRDADDDEEDAKPVLDADGVEICVGDTVYTLNDHRPYTVEAVSDTVAIRAVGGVVPVYRAPLALTHNQPDTWERIEEDADKTTCAYFGSDLLECQSCPMEGKECMKEKCRIIVRRCRALAERGAL